MRNRVKLSAKFKCSLFALLLVATPSLSGCQDNIPQVQTQAQAQIALPPVLDSDQVTKIRAAIGETIKAAADASNLNLLANRVEGPELDLQKAKLIAVKAGAGDPSMTIPTSTRQLLVSNSGFWPRTVFVITDVASEAQTERLLVLNQASPHDNYKLFSVARLFANKEFPKFEVATTGSAEILFDDQSMKYLPLDILQMYADVLQNDSVSKSTSAFGEDALRSEIRASHNTSNEHILKTGGVQSETFTADISSIRALKTSSGGALMVGAVKSNWTRTAGGLALATPGSDTEKALFGDQTYAASITAEYLNLAVFYIPPKGTDERVQVLGAERFPVSVHP